LFMTGGLANPFAILLLAPVAIAATSLSLRNALGLLVLTLLCATGFALFSMPLPWIEGESAVLPSLYSLARWAALAISGGFVALYAYRVAEEARQTSSALTATELALARVQHLSQLDGLAAAAAHELGTPLATVSLVVREMAGSAPPNTDFADDLSLIEEQVQRCRSILGKLSSPGKLSGGSMEISSPVELAEMAAAPHRLLGVTITVTGDGPDPAPHCPRNPGALFGLGNLIENAVSFAEGAVTIRATWSESNVRIVISDDGAGFATYVLARIGEPYLSQRAAAKRDEDTSGGVGLGLFIARSLLERSRATLAFGNAEPPGKGAVVSVEWSRAAYEEGRRPEF
jgi:two-component system, sensor histidine kinase RegB